MCVCVCGCLVFHIHVWQLGHHSFTSHHSCVKYGTWLINMWHSTNTRRRHCRLLKPLLLCISDVTWLIHMAICPMSRTGMMCAHHSQQGTIIYTKEQSFTTQGMMSCHEHHSQQGMSRTSLFGHSFTTRHVIHRTLIHNSSFLVVHDVRDNSSFLEL